MTARHVDIANVLKAGASRGLPSQRFRRTRERTLMIRLAVTGMAAALLIGLAGCSQGNASTQRSPEDVLLGKPYNGPSQPTPRGTDGKPLLTGYWKLLRE